VARAVGVFLAMNDRDKDLAAERLRKGSWQ